MNTPATSPQERITRLVERAVIEAKRRNRGPIYHLLARMTELESESSRYKILQKYKVLSSRTIDEVRGLRRGFEFAVALIMKYRHRTPGITPDEIAVALRRLNTAGIFAKVHSENLPVAA
jgi:hypothetical protein